MNTRGIRGAISVDQNTPQDIKSATIELLAEIIKKNNIDKKDISHVLFSLTKDLNAAFPAKYARTELGFDLVPMICYTELDVESAIEKCLRVLMVVNSTKQQDEIYHIYLKDATKLRPDMLK